MNLPDVILRPLLTALLGVLAVAAIGAAMVPSNAQGVDSGTEYQRSVLPFLRQHCFACHDEREAAAGLRLDELGIDFLAGKTADLWKEVIDRINLDEMPPEDQPRPDPREAFAVVEWVGHELKEAEKAARMAGGRILSRRMNRDEYVNTIADLLYLDANFVQTLKEDLPGDGKAEGFDRLGAALLFDATQLSTYIELATRLSYFLWSTMPDEELLAIAEAGRLHRTDVLQQQVRRMLADPKARQFAENFAGQWLHVRDYASVMPARDYRDYDDALRDAEAAEPIAFFETVVREDLSILNFLDSDFTVANERLARFYGIEGVQGPEFRRVPIDPELHRGGVLTMAGLLTYLADGTRTLPVRRGAWILEEIFNSPPPPPPPGAGEIQPNVKGEKLTVRERLEQHRQNATCASCHAKIDPLGLALENYDAIGAWRTHQNGEEFRGGNTPVIDASGTLPGGREFSTPAEFKQALLEEKDRFARAFTQKMLTYALCRPVGYTDKAVVEEIVGRLKEDDYRMQTLVSAIVESEAFRVK